MHHPLRRPLSKIELVALHSLALQEHQSGAFLRRYSQFAYPAQPTQPVQPTRPTQPIQPLLTASGDISRQQTLVTQTLTRVTAEHDLRDIALVRSLNKLIHQFLHEHGKLPDVIRIHPDSAKTLYDGGFCIDQRFRYDYKRWTPVFIPLQVDRSVKNTGILLDHFKPAC